MYILSHREVEREEQMTALKSYRYRVVDVFTSQALEGNPLAVFSESTGLDPETMQKIALELNLSETVFLVPAAHPECVARLRIFTPGREVDFAGHPTIGTAYVLLDEERVPKGTQQFVVQENVGPISIRVEAGTSPRIWLTTPAVREEGVVDRLTAASLLGVKSDQLLGPPPEILNAGNPTLFIPVSDRETVDRTSFDTAAWSRFKATGHAGPLCVFVFARTPEGAYSRMFAPDYGIREDPATGSSTGPLAYYMMKHRLAPSKDGANFYSEQGTKMGRRSILHLLIHGEGGVDGIEVGGYVTPIIDGTIHL
jgi:trans-2,3-dihydro-3-hydroxyanthranilate isomerase